MISIHPADLTSTFATVFCPTCAADIEDVEVVNDGGSLSTAECEICRTLLYVEPEEPDFSGMERRWRR